MKKVRSRSVKWLAQITDLVGDRIRTKVVYELCQLPMCDINSIAVFKKQIWIIHMCYAYFIKNPMCR